jgi:hypothetical protein
MTAQSYGVNMTYPNRRTVVLATLAAGTFSTASRVFAQSALPESDPQAMALGYRSANTKVDKAKYPQYVAGQMCGLCSFYQGKPSDALAPCQIFAGKQVQSSGWCSAYMKKG